MSPKSAVRFWAKDMRLENYVSQRRAEFVGY